ncbi:MAG: outer membrane beta-barrel protein [Bacteroidales bacterium]|nr:outer membrane beta-barrel protein [Bacteroidales bacterium]
MKRNKVVTLFFLLLVSFLMPKNTDAQIIEVGLSGDYSYYVGDINPKKHFSQSAFGFGGVVRYYDNLRWAFRFQYSNLNLQASDEVVDFRPERALAFNSKVNDFALLAEFNFFEYWTGSNRAYITPYIFGGISVFNYNSFAPDGTALQPLNTEGNFVEDESGNPVPDYYSKNSFSIPFGLGVKYSLCERIGMTLEWRIHKTFTDYIDDIHGKYPELENHAVVNGYDYTDPTGKFEPQMQRGNGDAKGFGYNNDWIGTLELSFVYRFNLPRKDACHSGIKARF